MTTPILEAEFQKTVTQFAMLSGWMIYHTHRSDRSESGFPDLVLVKSPRVVFAELKRDGRKLTKGRLNRSKTRWLTGQDEWAAALRGCPGVEYYTWWPTDWDQIERVLQGGK